LSGFTKYRDIAKKLYSFLGGLDGIYLEFRLLNAGIPNIIIKKRKK